MVNRKIIAAISMAMIFSMTVSTGCDLDVSKKSGVSSTSNSKYSSIQDSTVTSSQQTDSFHESSATNDPADIAAYFKDAEKYVLGDRTYYLDTREECTVAGEVKGYPLYYRENSKGIDMPLNILAFSIVSYGEYLYIHISKNDEYASDSPAEDTVYRLAKDGSKKFICDGNYYNVENALYRDNKSLYFTRFNENAVFKADLNCEKIERIPINLPNQSKIFTELKITEHGNLFSQYEVDEIKNDYLFFHYYVVNDGNYSHFYGKYKMSLTDHQAVEEFSMFEDYRKRVGDWIFYLDLNHPIKTEDEDLYEIHRIKSDGSGDANLKIQCYQFDFAENYIYADSDLVWGDFAHWSTYRYNLDGSGKKALPYRDMFRYYEDGRLYFTENWDNTLYVADTACNVLMKTKLTIPDEADLRKKLGLHYDLITIIITDKKGDWLHFGYNIMDLGGTYYGGDYRINLVSKKVEKISDEYTLPKDYVPESTDSQSK